MIEFASHAAVARSGEGPGAGTGRITGGNTVIRRREPGGALTVSRGTAPCD